jgi:alpha-L-glutamate ligase-like protein
MVRSKWRFWLWPSELRRRGVLGINRRNARYVLGSNPRAHYPRVDDKLLTKQICQARGIRVPQTYAVIQHNGEIRRFLELVGDRQEFVVKPAKGAEGRGIVVIVEHDDQQLTTSSGQKTTLADLAYHLSTILSGLYSLAGQPDRAIVEQRIVRHPVFADAAVGGTPDIRIILYRGVPVMAMVRLPTQASRGRANLHQGAVAAGVDLRTGQTLGGVCRGRAVTVHPDTGKPIAGLQVPEWEAILAGSVDLAEGLELGYLGVDFVVDADLGPVVLEANARPGLAIQVANRQGLVPRLEYLDALPTEMLEPKRRRGLVDTLAGIVTE